MDITIHITPAQKKALETDILDIEYWLKNWVEVRANGLMDEIVKKEVIRLIESGQTVSGTKDEIVLNAPVLSVAEKNAQLEQSFQHAR